MCDILMKISRQVTPELSPFPTYLLSIHLEGFAVVFLVLRSFFTKLHKLNVNVKSIAYSTSTLPQLLARPLYPTCMLSVKYSMYDFIHERTQSSNLETPTKK